MEWRKLLLLFLFLASQVVSAQAPSVTLTPSGTMSVCAGSNVSVSASVANAFAGTTSYTVADVAFAPYTLLAGTSLTMPDDTVLGPFPIGFQFCFFGNTYTQFYVGSNGWVGFSPGQTRAFTANSIPNTTTFVPRNCIMGPWMDFNPGIAGGPYIKYQTQGIAPYRRLVVQWTNCPLYQCIASKATFQIVLFESTNVIENYITNKPICALWAGGTATQGLHNQAGTVAFAVPGRNASAWTATNDGKRYQPNGLPSYTINWTSNGIPIGTGATASTTVNGPGMSRIIGRVNFQCSNLIVYDTLDVSIGGSASAAFSIPPVVCAGQAANFTYTGGATGTGAWTFASGTPVSASGTGTVSTTWATPGTYNVGLTVTPSSGLCLPGSLTQAVTVVAPPTSSFSLPASVCTGASASMTYTGTAAAGFTYTWNFGTNATPATATGVGPYSVAWSTTGSKTVTLTVGNGTCSSTTTHTINVNTAPTSTFTASPATVCIGASSSLTYTGTAAAGVTYVWNFGTGATPATASTVGPHAVTWSSAGSKNITLTVTAGGCSSAITTQVITVNTIPTAAFTLPATVCVGANTSISYNGTGLAPPSATYSWNISGGSPAPGNVQGPFGLSWATAGSKTVSLSVSQGGCASVPVSHTINVIALPTVAIAAASATVCTGQAASFSTTGAAQPAGTTYSWSFGAGANPVSSVSAGPVSVTWASVGSPSASLIVTSGGCSSTAATAAISVISPPISSITAPPSGCIGVPVTVSAPGPFAAGSTFNWNFGSATVLSGSGSGPYSIQWSTSGLQPITLTVTSGACSSSSTVSVDIRSASVASFSVPATVCLGQSGLVSFTGTAGTSASYVWNFGAGASPATANTAGPHAITWSMAGSKTISLTLTDGVCSIPVATQTVSVNSASTSTFTLPANTCTGATAGVTYTGNAPAGATYTWNFGTGATPATASTVGPHSIIWNTAGTSTTSLTVTSGGCSSTSSLATTVNATPVASISMAATAGVSIPSNVGITGAAQAGAIYSWNFGVNASPATAIGVGPHAVNWSTAGVKTVVLTVTLNGCTATASQTITVVAPATSTFTLPASLCAGTSASVAYTGNAAAGASFAWNFDGGVAVPGTGVGPHTVTWSTAGVKTVHLIVTQGGFSSSDYTSSVTVNPVPTSTFTLPGSVCVGGTAAVAYTGTASGTASYVWNFGASAIPASALSVGPHSISWSSSGTKNIVLSVTENGCTSTPSTQSITVQSSPVVTFTAPTPVCQNAASSISINGAAVAGVSYSWNFGLNASPATATGAGPHMVSWTTSGSKTVSLTATQNGCSASPVTGTVIVNPMPNSTFTLTTPSCVNEVVTANYSGNAGTGASYNWVYTGGTLVSGSGAGPLQLSWATAGNANVQLTVTENGCSSATSTQTTTIQAAPIFTISSPAFTGENTSTTITYSGTQPAGASYVWNFNGATVLSGSGAGPYQVQWSTAGTYTVSCTVNLNGCSASTQTSSTQVVSAAIATFTADSPLCPTEVSNVVFTGFALPSASFSWNFDGGTIISGTGPGPFQISWPTSGVKNVTLQVTQLGVSSALMSQLVTVHAIPTATFASTDPYCAGRNITFNYSGSASSSAAYTWNFGSGVLQSSVTGSSYTVEFPTVMTETVTLSVTENGCISVPVSLSVNLQSVPLATFTATPSVCENAPVYLNYTGGAFSSSSFSWDFDGATVTSGSASGPFEIYYPGYGNYSIALVVNDGGCPSDTFFVPVTVTPSPTNNFSITSTGCSADSVVVTYTGNATASATYVWDFESAVGYSGSGQGPYSALFPGSGSYPVGLFVMENGCMSAISEVQIPLNASPVATFTLTDTVYVNQVATAVFTGQSPVGSSMTWAYPMANWLNGGAGGPIELNWNSPGTYQVTLTMDNSGCVDGPHVQDVVVLPLPTAAFALSQDSICAGSSVMVTYSGTGTSQALYNWNFDGATIISGSGFGPYELSWPSESVHTVSLSVSVNGISTPAFSEYVTVIGIPVATFNLLDEACAGTSVTASFSSVTTLNAQFQWVTAGADSVDASDPANIQLIWNTPGVRNVILSVADAMCISAPVSHMIHVFEVPQASFVLPEYACLNSDMEVVYTGSVISGASYDWNFGNAGVVGNDAGPYTLNYSTAGTAHITLLVTANGCSSNLVDSTLVIRNLPVAQAGADVLLCAGDTVQLATPFETGNSYTWFPLGGLNSDTVSNPMISLSTIHNYVESVEYTVTVGDGYCTNTDQVIVQIAPRPTANFVHPDDQCFEGNSFSFVPNGSFTDEATFFWNLGPHAYTHSPADKEQHAVNFETTGPQFVSLSVSQFGCTSDVYVDSVFVHANPTTTFLAHNIKGCVPLESTFEASSSANGSTTYTWNFGDGNSATGDSLSHEYAVSGYMSVSVTATDSNGCTATYSEQNAVQVLEQPVAGFRTSPEIVFIGADDLELTSLSENALYCYYIIGADTILGCTNTYSFTNEGVYPITQVVLNALGCTDEITHTVTVEFGTEYYVPSAFTPNNDGKNDEFKIVGSDVKAFSLIIFDRWGNEIFTSDNISKGWDGIASENQPMPEGVYVYRLEMKSKTNRDILKNGAVTLLR